MYLMASLNYGEVKEGFEYRILETGYDYYLMSVRGRALYVPKWVFED